MTTQDTLALAATIWDEAKNLENSYRNGQSSSEHARDLAVHSTRCQTLYLKLCEQGTPGYRLDDVRVAAAARKVSEALADIDVDQIRVPAVLTLALLNLERVIKRTKTVELGRTEEQRFADTLAKKCDELAAENKRLEKQLLHYKRVERGF